MLSLEDYASLGAAEMARQVKAGSLSPVEIVEAALSVQQSLDASLHAFCTPTPEAARAAARALESAHPSRRSGRRACRSSRRDQGSRRHQGCPHHLRFEALRGFHPRRRRRCRRAPESRRRDHSRKDQRFRIRLRRLRPQPGFSHDAKPLEPGPDAGRFERGLGRRGRQPHVPDRGRQRWRRFDTPAGVVLWASSE